MEPSIIQLPKIEDERGNLSFFQNADPIPFEIKRVYWIYDVPGGEERGGHAYKDLQEFIVALSGGFEVLIHDGKKEYQFTLNRSYYGLYVPRGMWREMRDFSTNSLALIAADKEYDKDNYIRGFDNFLNLSNA